MSWKPYNVQQLGSKSKSSFNFLHSEFFTITYKPLKATLLWATRLVIGCICFCWISPQYFNLFCIMFNSRNPYERLHYPWFCKKSPPIILFLIKGTVHPKMKILSSFTHPRVIPNLYKFLSYVEHKRRYFEEFRWTKKLLAPIDFHCRERNTMKVNGDHQLFLNSWWSPLLTSIVFLAFFKTILLRH